LPLVLTRGSKEALVAVFTNRTKSSSRERNSKPMVSKGLVRERP
jgi:hypothetical protein